jgi:hypothetical protein
MPLFEVMSRLTEILLSVFPEDEHHLEDLSFWIRDQAPKADDRADGSPGNLLPVAGAFGSEAWGGSKLPTATIWAGVTNYLNVDAFVEHVADLDWDEPDWVQLLLRDDGDPWFRLYMIRDGEIRQYSPPPPLEGQDRPW